MLTDGKYEYEEYQSKRNGGKKVKERLGDKGEFLGMCRRTANNNSYYHVRFFDCGHECFIAKGKKLQCNHPDCKRIRASAVRKAIYNRPGMKEKLSIAAIKSNARLEVKEKHRAFFAEYWGKEENRKMMSEKITQYFANPDNRKAQSERQKEFLSDERNREKIRKSVIDWHSRMSDEEKAEINERRKKTMQTEEFRQAVSSRQIVRFSDRANKQEYLESRAEYERRRENKHEVFFMRILDEKNIQYIWQKPLMAESGKGYVIDFYLPEFDIYVNIDGCIHGGEGIKDTAYIKGIKEKDRQLDEYCEEHNIRLIHIKVKDMESDSFELREVIGL